MGGVGGSGGGLEGGNAGWDGGSAGATAGSAGANQAGAPLWGIEERPIGQTCNAPPARDQAPLLLSQTGCVDATDPKKPGATLIPYDVASPLWSDGADKLRYFALPDGASITVKDCETDPSGCEPSDVAYTQDEGDWDFPDGTVLVKTFSFGERLIETRLLIRIDRDNWWGYSYEWRTDQSDADLLPSNMDGYVRTIETSEGLQPWHFPSRSQCLQCHTDITGRALGLETAQLNTPFAYPNGVVGNQLETLKRIGLFAEDGAPRELPAYPDPSDPNEPIGARARSYLHANCSNCHRRGTDASVLLDLRFEASFADTKLCNEPPEKGDLDVADALLITPGDPEKSVLSLRMHTLNSLVRMPQIGTQVVDEGGTCVIDAWIRSLTDCP